MNNKNVLNISRRCCFLGSNELRGCCMKRTANLFSQPTLCDLCGQPIVDELFKCFLPEYGMVKICLECFEDNNGKLGPGRGTVYSINDASIR